MLGLRSLRRMGPLGAAMTLGQMAWVLRRHWQTIPPQQRGRLGQLLRQAKGNPSRLSPSERRELGELVRALKLPGLARELAWGAVRPGRFRPPAS